MSLRPPPVYWNAALFVSAQPANFPNDAHMPPSRHLPADVPNKAFSCARADTNTASEVSPGSLLGAAVHCFVLFFFVKNASSLYNFLTFFWGFFLLRLLSVADTHTLTVAVWNHV